MQSLTHWIKQCALVSGMLLALGASAQTQPQSPIAATSTGAQAAAAAPALQPAALATPAAAGLPAAAQAQTFSGGDTAWMLISTVLVMLMTMPGIILFYSGMLRSKNALSIVAHTVAGAAVITLLWSMFGYSIAFTSGGPLFGDASRFFGEGLVGSKVGAHLVAPTIPESVFFLFQLSFAIITFALVLGATAERMRLGATLLFAIFWLLLIYAPVAHWIWHPNGWLAKMGHMDFAGGTVVHVLSGATGLAAAIVLGPRRGFGKEPMVPHNLLITVLGAGLLWAGWFGFNAGSAFEASARAAGALLATQVAACAGAMLWGMCEYLRRGQWSVLGTMTGAIAGLIAVTPASGFVGIGGALAIGALAGMVCFFAVVSFKAATGIDDSLDVFALHGVGGLLGTVLTPVFAITAVAPITATVWTNSLGAVAVMAYAGGMTWVILKVMSLLMRLRVDAAQENLGLDISEHGEMLAPNT